MVLLCGVVVRIAFKIVAMFNVQRLCGALFIIVFSILMLTLRLKMINVHSETEMRIENLLLVLRLLFFLMLMKWLLRGIWIMD